MGATHREFIDGLFFGATCMLGGPPSLDLLAYGNAEALREGELSRARANSDSGRQAKRLSSAEAQMASHTLEGCWLG